MMQYLFFILSIFLSIPVFAQMKIGGDPTTINSSAILELESTNSALRLPRMTNAQRDSMQYPTNGMMIYNAETNCIDYAKSDGKWYSLCSSLDAAEIPADSCFPVNLRPEALLGTINQTNHTADLYANNLTNYPQLQGKWSILQGASLGEAFVYVNSDLTIFAGKAGQTYTLLWSITNPNRCGTSRTRSTTLIVHFN